MKNIRHNFWLGHQRKMLSVGVIRKSTDSNQSCGSLERDHNKRLPFNPLRCTVAPVVHEDQLLLQLAVAHFTCLHPFPDDFVNYLFRSCTVYESPQMEPK